MKALVINSCGRHTGSNSRLLVAELLKELEAMNPGLDVQERDISQGLPFVNDLMIQGYFSPPETHTPEVKASLRTSEGLIAELKAADILVLGAPMYNFSVPASLKAWLDLVVRAGHTFAMTPEGGFEGLLHGKKTYIVVTTGATDIGSAQDVSTPYLRLILGVMGLTDIEFFTAGKLMFKGEGPVLEAREAIHHIA